MPICCATGAQSPMPPGGSRMPLISSNWSTTSLGWIVRAGARSDGKPKPLRANSSSAFAFATAVSNTSRHWRRAGLPLLRRDFCPDGFKREIQKALIKAKRMIAILSPHYLRALKARSEGVSAFKRAMRDKQEMLLTICIHDHESVLEELSREVIYIDIT